MFGWSHALVRRAVSDADRLVSNVLEARGYPVGAFELRAADISVDHPMVVEHFRAAHAIALQEREGKASTEDLRQAMVHYRALFEDLLMGGDTTADRAGSATPAREGAGAPVAAGSDEKTPTGGRS